MTGFNGGPPEIRIRNLLRARELLYQLELAAHEGNPPISSYELRDQLHDNLFSYR